MSAPPDDRSPATGSATESPSVLTVVATLGRSPFLEDCLRSVRAQDAPCDLELTVVFQGSPEPIQRRALEELADTVVSLDGPAGFARANNRGIAPALRRGGDGPDLVATVNDDAILEPGWLSRLLAVMTNRPEVGAVQGLNLATSSDAASRQELDPDALRIDSAGIRWNRRLQAVQRGHREPLGSPAAAEVDLPGEVWGVSATAALYRSEALRQIADDGAIFDEVLETYYEDVDLARRLRAAGWTAWCEPDARCLHHVSLSAPAHRPKLLVANRHLVLARLLGRRYWSRLPGLLLRDLADFGAGAIPGWGRAVSRGLPSWHLGPAQSLHAVPPREASP